MAAADDSGDIWILNTKTGNQPALLRGHRQSVVSISFDHTGERLLATGLNLTTSLRDWRLQQALLQFNNATVYPRSAAFSSDDRWVATVDSGTTVHPRHSSNSLQGSNIAPSDANLGWPIEQQEPQTPQVGGVVDSIGAMQTSTSMEEERPWISVYREDYSRDPAYVSTDPDNLYWDEAEENYVARVYRVYGVDSGVGLYLSTSPTFDHIIDPSRDSFRIEMDIYISHAEYGLKPKITFMFGEPNDNDQGSDTTPSFCVRMGEWQDGAEKVIRIINLADRVGQI